MIKEGTTWAIELGGQCDKTYIAQSWETTTEEGSKVIRLTGDLVWVWADAYRIEHELETTSMSLRLAHPSEIVIYKKALNEIRLNKLLDAAGVVSEAVLDRAIPEEVKALIRQVPELKELAHKKLGHELTKLINRWSGGK